MMRYNFLFLLVFILSGCQSAPINLNDEFVSFKPRIAPDKLSGIWSIKSDSVSWTLKINNNGTGVSCISRQGENVIDEIKYDGGNLIVKNGAELEIKTFNAEQLIVSFADDEDLDYLFVKDDGRKIMSQFCFNYFAIW